MKFATYQDLIDNPEAFQDAPQEAFLLRSHNGTDELRHAAMMELSEAIVSYEESTQKLKESKDNIAKLEGELTKVESTLATLEASVIRHEIELAEIKKEYYILECQKRKVAFLAACKIHCKRTYTGRD
ncbi:hypothetical protein [Streptomyces microflavus]|uniref:hypothetical protein n=1 Tax=Streptomyces microflavus TaxID=1919 RepID=UPI003632F913